MVCSLFGFLAKSKYTELQSGSHASYQSQQRNKLLGWLDCTYLFGYSTRDIVLSSSHNKCSPSIHNSRASRATYPYKLVITFRSCSFSDNLLLRCIYSVASKTMVNPVWVEAGTFALVLVLTIYNLSTGVVLTVQSVGVLGFLIILSLMFITLIGIFQWLAVRWVIRMNFEVADRISYSIDMKPKEILHKLGTSFLDDWLFNRECDIGDIWILRRSDSYERNVLLEIGPHPKEENKSILATIAYELDSGWVIRSSSASNMRDIIVKNIEDRLSIKFTDTLPNLDDPVSKLAYDNVKDLATSRIEVTWVFLRKLPRLFKVMLGLTLALLVGISVAYFNYPQWGINSDTYVGAIVVLIVALFVEIGLPLREEIQKRKREEIEF